MCNMSEKTPETIHVCYAELCYRVLLSSMTFDETLDSNVSCVWLPVHYTVQTVFSFSCALRCVTSRCLYAWFSDTPAVTYRGKTQLRNFSSSKETDVSYEQLKKLLAAGTASVIDVREPWELREYGNIPGSINVPCKSFFAVTKRSYGAHSKNTVDYSGCFSCLNHWPKTALCVV